MPTNEEQERPPAQSARAEVEFGNLSDCVSHDLRSPLQAIDIVAYLLETEYAEKLGPQGTELVAKIRKLVIEADNLLDGLVEYSRIVRQQMVRAPVNLAEIARAATEALAPKLQGRTVEIRIGQLPTVNGDCNLLRRLFAELLSNALKFSVGRERAVIEVKSCEADGEPVISVSDNGVGFDTKDAGRLFIILRRLHRPEQFDGIGIGLAIAKNIVERHGGRIWAQAAPGEGAAFSFTLAPSQTATLPAV